jgi:hypothetical protein
MKRAWLILCCALASLAQAQPPQLGRLFSSPEERAQLDASRSGSGTPPAGAAPVAPPPPPPPPGPPMELNGLVQRSSGRSTVWLNQTPQQEPYNQVSGASQLTLRLSNGQVVLLKPGQQYDPASGTVMETRP